MEFHILGPLEIVRHGRALELGAGKQRTLLAMLLLHANEVVSTDRLIDALWGEQAPATAPKIVQGYVSRLRKVLDAGHERPDGSAARGGILLTRSPGYVLRVEEGQLDADRFATLLASARTALARGAALEAATLLREALDLWRGPPLADFGFDTFAQEEIARLEELRLAAVEERVEADLALGRGTRGRRRARGARRPSSAARAAARAADARALSLRPAGRGAGRLPGHAARAGRRARPRAEPGDRGARAGDPPSGPRARRPPAARGSRSLRPRPKPAPFEAVGRTGCSWGESASSPLSSLRSETRSPAAGGSWSSAASRESARAASRRSWRAEPASDGAEIHWGRCWEEGGAPPYWPWVQVLRACVRERGAEQLADELGAGASEIAELVPDVRQRLPELQMPSGSADPQQARFRLFDAVSGFLTRASRSRPLVIVLDDLNWADEGSLLLLEFVARELAETQRAARRHLSRHRALARPPARQTLGELSRERLFERVLLRGLAHEDVARFVEAACGFAAGPCARPGDPRPDGGQPVLRRRGRQAPARGGGADARGVRHAASSGARVSPTASARPSGDGSSASHGRAAPR